MKLERDFDLEDGTSVHVEAVDARRASRGRNELGEVIVVFNGDYFLTCNWSDAARLGNAFLEAAENAKYLARK